MISNRKLLTLLNHEPTSAQKEQLLYLHDISEIVRAPAEAANIWLSIPPEQPSIVELLQPVVQWISENSQENDWLWVQGDGGAVFVIVQYALKNQLIPVYATTKRESIEYVENGKTFKKSVFSHIQFRRYEEYTSSDFSIAEPSAF